MANDGETWQLAARSEEAARLRFWQRTSLWGSLVLWMVLQTSGVVDKGAFLVFGGLLPWHFVFARWRCRPRQGGAVLRLGRVHLRHYGSSVPLVPLLGGGAGLVTIALVVRPIEWHYYAICCCLLILPILCHALAEVTVTEDGFEFGVFWEPSHCWWDAIRSYAWEDDVLDLVLPESTHRWRIAPDVRPVLETYLRERVGPPSPLVEP